jgi:hypothetical protein
MSRPTVSFTTKLGTTRAGERTRIWIEGKRLTDAGFKVGDRFIKIWNDDERRMAIVKATAKNLTGLRRDQIGTVSGKGEKPIIDITGARVQQVFGIFASVVATYDRHSIHIECGTAIKVGSVG